MGAGSDDMGGRRVVLIEDSALCRGVVRDLLASEGLDIHEAEDGSEGVALCERIDPDLVLLDLVLPSIDGFTVLQQIRQCVRPPGPAVIFLSEFASADQRAAGIELGAVDFVPKPFHGPELRARVRGALRTRAHQAALERRARTDGLTGLGNRGALEERLAALAALSRRRAAPLSLIIADLDHFKRINDEHGHATGDLVLRWVAGVLKAQAREGDMVARFGGEEFVIVAPDCERLGAIAMAERIRQTVEDQARIDWSVLPGLSLSIGVATENDLVDLDPACLLNRADQALYRAKGAGRNCVGYWCEKRGAPQCLPTREAVLSA